MAFSPDGKTLASGGWRRTLKLWDTSAGKITATLQGHTEPVSSVAFSPDGRILVSGSKDHTIRLWDLATGKNTATVSADTGEAGSQEPGAGVVSCVAFSPDGKTLAAAIWDKTIRMWDVKIKKKSED